MDFNVTHIIFSESINSNRAQTKLRKAGIQVIGRGSRSRSNGGELAFKVSEPLDGYERADILKIGNHLKVAVQHNTPRASDPVIVKVLFNTTSNVANTFMNDLGIEKIGNGGRLKKGEYDGWVCYRIVPKGTGKNKKGCYVGGKFALYIASQGK